MEEKTEFRSLFSHLKNIVLQLFFENAKFFLQRFFRKSDRAPPVYEFRDRAPPCLRIPRQGPPCLRKNLTKNLRKKSHTNERSLHVQRKFLESAKLCSIHGNARVLLREAQLYLRKRSTLIAWFVTVYQELMKVIFIFSFLLLVGDTCCAPF